MKRLIGEWILGKWAFKYRGLAYIPLMAIMLLSFDWEFEDEVTTWSVGLILVMAGFALRLWAQKHVRRRGPKDNRPERQLAISGPYAFVRNPLYLGNMTITVGFAVLSELIWLVPIALLWLYFIYHSAVLYEEETLKERYGDRYAQYSSRVPRWLPSLRPMYRLNVAGCSYLEALKAEKGTAFMIIGAILLFIAKDVVDRVFLKGI